MFHLGKGHFQEDKSVRQEEGTEAKRGGGGIVKLDGLGSNSWQFFCHRCLSPWTKQPQSYLHFFCEPRAWHTLGKHTTT